MSKLSTYFHEDEFLYSAAARYKASWQPHQRWLAEQLCQNLLEPMRAHLGGYKFIVTSGYRDRIIIEALLEAGYGVSKHTDHSFLNPDVNWMGVGAADVMSDSLFDFDHQMRLLWNFIKAEKISPGQLIAYPYAGFFHVSNPKMLWFSEKAATMIPTQRDQYLVSPEMGRYITWSEYMRSIEE